MSKDKGDSRSLILEKIKTARKEQGFTDEKVSGEKEMTKNKGEINYSSTADEFISKLEKVGATVSIINHRDELVSELNRYVTKHQIQSEITVSKDKHFEDYEWHDVDITTDYEAQSISVSITYANFGIEETGTLVMLSSPGSPTGMNFLADHHLVVLSCNDIVKTMEDVWKLLRDEDGELPRTINMITGPSRTADIEQEIQIGAHGPKNLHVVLIKVQEKNTDD